MKRLSKEQRDALRRYNFSVKNCNEVRRNYTVNSLKEWEEASKILETKLFNKLERKTIKFRQNYIVFKQRGINQPDYQNE